MDGGAPAELPTWARWEVPICFVILAAPAAASAAAISRVRFDPLKPRDLWIPSCKRMSPLWLLALRGLALFVLCWLLLEMVLLDGAFAFYFYTQWTFTLVIIYFLIATFVSARGCWSYSKHFTAHVENRGLLKRDVEENIDSTVNPETNSNGKAIRFGSSYGQGDIEQKAGILENLMQITYQTSAGAVVLTDIVFWGLLVPFLSVEHFSLDLLMGCMHSVNAVFLLLDTALNSMPFPWFRISYFVLWSCVYVAFQWVLHACGFSWWPYPFLELSTPWAPMWYLSLALIHIPCFGLYAVIVKAKVSFLSKFFPQAYIRPC
ncbi:uncharacterized protein LOC109719082 isoform X1 [Ananas comosus]|uniref:Uncharacterized protein LOC109719082 isoform X1 n=1 Tax=Ananas comosus TaxID=4615 RepID=A0A6P5FXV5_ANACO|nr:uncharacterized protein LOC109719082 isoform X1 [Ananas comosus]